MVWGVEGVMAWGGGDGEAEAKVKYNYLPVEEPHVVQRMKVLLQECKASCVQGHFIQLKHRDGHPEQELVDGRVLKQTQHPWGDLCSFPSTFLFTQQPRALSDKQC